MSEAVKTQVATIFNIGIEARVNFEGRYFRATPFRFGYILDEVDGNRRHEFEHWQIANLMNDRVLGVEPEYFSIHSTNARALRNTLDLHDLPIDTVFRTRMVVMFLDGEAAGRWQRSKVSIETFFREFEEHEANCQAERGGGRKKKASDRYTVQWRQFCRLLLLFEERGRSPNALVRNYTGKTLHRAKFEVDVENYVQGWAAKIATTHRISTKSLYEMMVGDNRARPEPFELPKLRTFERRVKAQGELTIAAGHDGKDAARLKFLMSHGGIQTDRPLERIELDEWEVHLVTILQETGIWAALHKDVKGKLLTVKRAWLSAAIDHRTRSVLALRLLWTAPRARSAIETLEMAVGPKDKLATAVGTLSPWPQCGTPEKVATDAGAAYANHEFQACVLALTRCHLIPPSKNPHLRGTIERFFKTVDDRYLHLFSGRTFGNVVEKGTYDPVKNASLTFEELGVALVRLIVDCYHNTPHSALDGETPLDAWSRLTTLFPVKPFPDTRDHAKIFALTVRRRIGDRGIIFLGIPFISEGLQTLRNMDINMSVQIRVNLSDLSSIRMLTQKGDGYVEIPCAHEGFEGVGVLEWVRVVQNMNERFSSNAQRTDEAVRQTMREVHRVSSDAMKRNNIGEPIMDQMAIQRIERNVIKSFVFAKKSKPDYPSDLRSPPSPPEAKVIETPSDEKLGKDRQTILGMGEAPTHMLPSVDQQGEARTKSLVARERDGTTQETQQPSDEASTPTQPTASTPWTFDKK